MTSALPICHLDNPDHPLVEDAPRRCVSCASALCLRKQVLNLAMGITDEMLCLACLARQNERTEAELLSELAEYIASRQCFARQWQRYESREYCPDQSGCVTGVCFQNK